MRLLKTKPQIRNLYSYQALTALGILRLWLNLANAPIVTGVQTPIPWQSAEQDDLGLWSLSRPTEIPVPDGATAFDLSTKIFFNPNNNGTRHLMLLVNGAEPSGDYLVPKIGSIRGGGFPTHIPLTVKHCPCVPGDILSVAVLHTSTASPLPLPASDGQYAQFIFYGGT